MRGDEFWGCTIGEADKQTYTLQYDGKHAELFVKFEGHVHSFLLPAEMMDRLAVIWQQWRQVDVSGGKLEGL